MRTINPLIIKLIFEKVFNNMSEMITVVGKLQTLFKELDKTSKKD